MEVRLRVDWIRCDGYGLCGDFVPDLIDLDEWRYPILRPGPVEAEPPRRRPAGDRLLSDEGAHPRAGRGGSPIRVGQLGTRAKRCQASGMPLS